MQLEMEQLLGNVEEAAFGRVVAHESLVVIDDAAVVVNGAHAHGLAQIQKADLIGPLGVALAQRGADRGCIHLCRASFAA